MPRDEIANGCRSVCPGVIQAESGELYHSTRALMEANGDGVVSWDALRTLVTRIVERARAAEERNAA